MEFALTEWLFVVLNTVVIGAFLAIPLLIVALAIRALRRGISQDREGFENEVRLKLAEIAESQASLQKQLDDRAGS